MEMDSDKAEILAKNSIIEVDEQVVTETATRVHFAQGWVSMATGAGDTILEPC